MDLSVAIFLIFNSIICKVLLCCKNVKWLELVPLCIVIFQNNICWNIFHDVFFSSKASAAFNNLFFAVNLYFKFKPHMIELNNLGSLSVPDLIKVAYTCSLHGNIKTQSLTFHTNIRVPHHSLNCLLKDVHVCKVAEVLLQKCVVEHASCFSTYTEHALSY